MKKQEENKQEKVDKEKNELIKGEKYSFSKTGSLGKDLENLNKITKIKIEEKELPEIELQKIVIRETGNFLNLQENYVNIPVEMIIFPFFTPQKQNKRINFEYTFEDLGVKMSSTLIVKGIDDKVFQPSIFEEKIYLFLISMYQTMCEEKNKKNEKNENLSEDEIAIRFEISDFIVKFLGNKMNRAYYAKVEQALKNLKNTQYQFEISNHTKFGENKFEDREFKLLTYKKMKVGKKIYYEVFLNKNIIKKIKNKRYIKYNTKTLVELMGEDPIASRIYRYISKERYSKQVDEINIRTLAAIIPLKIEQHTIRKTKSGTKEYVLNRMKPVLTRIIKAFNILVKLEYLSKFEERFEKEEDTYYITYWFNEERDGDCHFSEFLKKSDKKVKKEISEDYFEEEILEADAEFEPVENTEYLISKIKNIPKYAPYFNKRVYNKFEKISSEEGEAKLKILLNILIFNDIKIEKSLVKTINNILKNIKKKNNPNKNLNLFGNVAKEKGIKTKSQINKARNRKMQGFEEIENIKKEIKRNRKIKGKKFIEAELIEAELIEEKNKNPKTTEKLEKKIIKKEADVLKEKNQTKERMKEKTEEKVEKKKNILETFDELTQLEIEKKAIELFEKEGGDIETVKNYKKFAKTIYYNIISSYIEKVIKDEY